VWKKLWPEAYSHLEEVEEETVIHNIVELASEEGLEGVKEDDVQELLQYHGESLANGELRELAKQRIQSEFTSEAEETPVRELSTESLSKNITAIAQAMDHFIDNGPDYERNSKAKRGALEIIFCYLELIRERKLKKGQSTVDAYIMKKPRFTEDPQPVPSSAVQLGVVTFIKNCSLCKSYFYAQ
jgi:hypothetical protein